MADLRSLDLELEETENSVYEEAGPGSSEWNIILARFEEVDKDIDFPQLKARLESLGVRCLSDLSLLHLSEDLVGIMKPVQCRRLQAELAKEKTDSSENNNKAASHCLDVSKLFSPNFMKLLNGIERLNNHDRRKFVRGVADEIHDTYRPVTEKICQNIAGMLTKNFKAALDTKSHDNGAADLAIQILAHARYIQKLDRKRKQPSADDSSMPRKRFNVRENYGLNEQRDLPNELPGGETRDSQHLKQQVMQDMARKGQIDWATVLKYMKDTYTSQRASIAEGKNMEEILILWPFIGKNQMFREHFYTLMNLQEDTIVDTMKKLFPKLIEFFTAEANNKNRKGKASTACGKIREVIKKYNSIEEKSFHLDTVAVTLCMAYKVHDNLDQLFLFFDETTSYDEVQASTKLPDHGKPIIAVLGHDVLNNPKCFVVVEKRCISTFCVKPGHAITLAFMAYFVFKITYPKDLAAVLEFFQRSVFKINLSGSRVERKKSKKGWLCSPSTVSSKYITLMREFEDYNKTWGSL